MSKTAEHHPVATPRRRTDPARDALFFLAMSVVTLALGIGFYLQFGLEFWLSAMSALAIYVALISLHAMIRRMELTAELRREVARLEGEVASMAIQPPRPDPSRPDASRAGHALPGAPHGPPGNTGHVHSSSRGAGPAHPSHVVPTRLGAPLAPQPMHPAHAPPPPHHPGPAAGPGAAVRPAAGQPPPRVPMPPPEAEARTPGGPAPFHWPTNPATSATTTAERRAHPVSNAMPAPSSSQQVGANAGGAVSGPGGLAQAGPRPTSASDQPGSELGQAWAYRPAATPAVERRTAPPPASAPQAARTAESRAAPAAPARSGPPPLAPALAPAAGAPSRTVTGEADIDAIHGMIRRLADEIDVAAPAAAGAAAPAAADEVERSVGALRVTAEAMRHRAPEAAATPHPHAADEPEDDVTTFARELQALEARSEPTRAIPGHLSAIATALHDGAIDVFLEPILDLAANRASHYEVSVRLRSPLGGTLEADAIQAARGFGLLPLLDAVKLRSTLAIARQMESRAKPGSLFSQIAVESLGSDDFLNGVAEDYQPDDTIAHRMVLAFSQADVRDFGAPHWSVLSDMAELGFRFALEHVTDLDQDFEKLKAAGFAFVKLDAPVFLEGLPADGGLVPASDLCRHLAGLGLALIVGAIADERVRARIHGFGVLLGQGAHFGAPRPVKADVLRGRDAA